MPFYEKQPYIQPLHTVIREVMQGDIRIPKFQRPGTEVTWRPEQRGALLDSIYRGFPVGTILLWATTEEIATLSSVGGFTIPSLHEKNTKPMRLVLDGHQRLSTLVQILGPGLTNAEPSLQKVEEEEMWVFEIGEGNKIGEHSRDRFILLKKGRPPSKTQIPLSIVLNLPKLNRWIREKDLSDDQTQIADGLRGQFREYSMPVAVLVTDSLNEATESFKRINSSGIKMGTFHMVSALAYKSAFDPQDAFSEAREKFLEPVGWEGVSDSDILRVCAGLAKMPPQDFNITKLAKQLQKNPDLVKKAFREVLRSTEVFANFGVLSPKILPYHWQLITLSINLHRIELNKDDRQDKLKAIEQWFWLTTYGGVFGGINSSIYKRASQALLSLCEGKSAKAMENDISRKLGEVTRFDFRSARSKACALAMARLQDRNDRKGPAHNALTQGISALKLLFNKGNRATWWHLFITTPENTVEKIRKVVSHPNDYLQLLAGLGCPENSEGTTEELLEARRQTIIKQERVFVQELGFEWEANRP